VTVEPREVEIARLGAQGDGVAETPAGNIHIPYALPGERWQLGDGRSAALLRPHPQRAAPPCPHFGSCGGCVAQHMPDALYDEW